MFARQRRTMSIIFIYYDFGIMRRSVKTNVLHKVRALKCFNGYKNNNYFGLTSPHLAAMKMQNGNEQLYDRFVCLADLQNAQRDQIFVACHMKHALRAGPKMWPPTLQSLLLLLPLRVPHDRRAIHQSCWPKGNICSSSNNNNKIHASNNICSKC